MTFSRHSQSPPGRDPLTGLEDAGTLAARLDGWQAAVTTAPAPLHAMIVGLGRFDTVNLAYGATAGDGALIEVARRLLTFATDELSDGEWAIARVGGGRFVLVARQPISRERWQWLAEAVADALSAPIAALGNAGSVRLWPRIAILRVLPGERAVHVIDRLADTLARAQDRPGARLLWSDRASQPIGIRTAELEADLLTALDRDEIEIVFQPQYAIVDDRLIGAEALARWRHPRLGAIGAGALFAIAERADHVAQLSRHIARRALEAAAAWPDGVRLSLNVTSADLAVPGLDRQLLRIVTEAGFRPKDLTVEITEQVLLGDLELAAASLTGMRRAGIHVALDDFGGGFCNFRYLKLLPLDALKLDRSMIEGIENDARDRAVLRAIVALARSLDLTVVAEGVESDLQRVIAGAEGCAIYQGFLRSRPMPGAAFAALVEEARVGG